MGYKVLDVTGSVSIPRTTSGVYQTAPGIYAAYVTFPDDFRGSIVWDTGTIFSTTSYASEQYNYEENNPRVDYVAQKVDQMSTTIGQLYDIQYGRWKIINNQMIFYKDDNSTEVARFDLYDDSGNATMDAVFDRIKV